MSTLEEAAGASAAAEAEGAGEGSAEGAPALTAEGGGSGGAAAAGFVPPKVRAVSRSHRKIFPARLLAALSMQRQLRANRRV